MPNIYFAGLFAVMVVLGIGGAYVKGRSDGTAITTSIYAQRDVKAAQDYATKEREITAQYRAKEQAQASSFAAVSKNLQVERSSHAKTKTDLNAALVAGSLVLRDPGTTGAPTCGGPAQIAAGASGNNDKPESGLQGPAAGVLSREASTFLITFADDADTVTTQLQACQQILTEERTAN